MNKRIVVGITGGSCSIYAVALLTALKELGVESHVVVSKMGAYVLDHECGISMAEVRDLSTVLYEKDNLAAAVASGSFKTDGMIIIPCSMNTLGAIANGLSLNLIQRAADVTLKEKRKLVIVPRETPLTLVHLDNMKKLAEAGATILPAAPGFYHLPETLEDIVAIMVGRALDQLGIDAGLFKRWE